MDAKYHILYNPLAGNKSAKEEVKKLNEILKGNVLEYTEMTPDFDYNNFIKNINTDENVVICGGDGTLNRFLNQTDKELLKRNTFYFPVGSGNDFNRDVFGDTEKHLIDMKEFSKNLPTVTVHGKKSLFINGIGYGIDGWCCEVGDELRKKSSKPINYTAIAVKGALFQYKKTKAKVIVDGKEYHFKNVFLAATMKGRFYGGGMMATPEQDRKNPDGKVSVLIFRGFGRVRPLLIFSKIFTGEHIKKTNNCIVITGKEVYVEFDSPRPLQIDGDTVKNVSSYTVTVE